MFKLRKDFVKDRNVCVVETLLNPPGCQVNADVVDLIRLSDGQVVKLGGSTESVGRFISTKAVGSDERHDITHQYKYPEGAHTHTHTPNTRACVHHTE